MSGDNSIRKGATTAKDPRQAAAELFAQIGQAETAWGLFYCSPEYDREVLAEELHRLFGDVPLMGCTTAGEITPLGYIQGSITGFTIAPPFRTVIRRLPDLDDFDIRHGKVIVREMLAELEFAGQPPTPANTFACLLVDGLSMQEELVVSSFYQELGDIPLFGGSAGDGTEFGSTWVYHDGAFHTNSAVLALAQTEVPFKVFKTEHFVSSSERMVVTESIPAQRTVTEINGEPALREYARMVGVEVHELNPMIFAAHPVVVQIGGEVYVRSIQKVNDDESLTFFCAIDEGIVLTVARSVDIVSNLESLFEQVREEVGPPELVIGCDCILRSLECDQQGLKGAIGEIMTRNNVVGFSTYGEQFNALHVNQTFTGVAIGASAAHE